MPTALATVLAFPATHLAAVPDPDAAPVVAGVIGTTISGAQWLNLAVNVLLPIVVALVTSRAASGSVKAVTLLALSAVSGLLTSWLAAAEAGAPFDISQAGFTVVTGFVVAVAAHFGAWKPAGVTGASGRVQLAVPAGVGGRRAA